MRIIDWSSDVCSSDLGPARPLALVLDGLDDSANAEQRIDARRLVRLELPGDGDDLVQQRAVEAQPRRRFAARHGESEREVAPLEPGARLGAGGGLQPVETGGEAAAEVERLALDAACLPGSGITALGAVDPGAARNSVDLLDTQRVV